MVRPFKNDDLPRMVRCCDQHHAPIGNFGSLTIDAVLSRIVGRPDFQSDRLWVDDGDNSDHSVEPNRDINAWGVRIDDHAWVMGRDDSLGAIIAELRRSLGRSNPESELRLGLPPELGTGLVGVPPLGWPMGVIEGDPVAEWATRNGWTRAAGYQRHAVASNHHRTPMSRAMLRLRRSERVCQTEVLPAERWATAHLDFIACGLESSPRHSLVEIYSADLNLMLVPPDVVMIRLTDYGREHPDHCAYAIATYVASRSKSTLKIQAVVPGDDSVDAAILNAAGIPPDRSGTIFETRS